MIDYKISIVIRTYNEKKHIKSVLDSLFTQEYKNFEVIIVDSGSNDGTKEIFEQFPVKVVNIKKEDFNYSYASNIGVEHASGDIICFLSGHSVPVSNNYLELTNSIFQNERVGACYGEVIALPDGSFTEKSFNYIGMLKSKLKLKGKESGVILEKKIHPGIFSCSNASARKDLLIKFPFQVELGKGGEDVEGAFRIIEEGYVIAKVPELLVQHSHGKNFIAFLQEYKGWKTMYADVISYIERSKR